VLSSISHQRQGYFAFPAVFVLAAMLLPSLVHVPLVLIAIVGWLVFYWSFLHLRTHPAAVALMCTVVLVASAGTAVFVVGRWWGYSLPGYSIVNTQVG
jgi:hypothetical protein